MTTIHIQRDYVIQIIAYDYGLLDCIRLTPFKLKSTISNPSISTKKIKEEILLYYRNILFHEIAFKKALTENKNDTYQTLFETYNFSYRFYCNALKRTNRLMYTCIDHLYFEKLYKEPNQLIPFNPLKENLLLLLTPNHEPKQIILS